MNRRDSSIALLAFAALPLAVDAQQPGRVYRIGYLLTDPRTPLDWTVLAKLGWV